MHEEEGPTGARRGYKKIEILIDSGDDEPIGFLLKPPKHQNHKKEFGGESGGSVPEKSKSIAINHHVDDDDPGGMDDTLACFRKRLKIPKKNHTPTALAEHNYLVNFTGSSPQNNLDPVVECVSDRRKYSEHTDQNLNVREKKRFKRSKKQENNDTTRESVTGSSFLNLAEGTDINLGVDEDFDDLLSSFVKKTHSQLIRSRQVITSTICSSIRQSPLKKFHRRKHSETIRPPESYMSVADISIDQGTSLVKDVSDSSNLCEVHVLQDFSPPIDFCEELTPVRVFSGEVVEFDENSRYTTMIGEGGPSALISNEMISHSPAEITDKLNHFSTENLVSIRDSDAATPNSLLESIPIEEEQKLRQIEQSVHLETNKEEKDSVIGLDLFFNEEKKRLLFKEMYEEFHKESVEFLPIYCPNSEQKSLSTIVNHDSDTIDIDVTFNSTSLEVARDDTEFYTGLPAQYSSSGSQLEGPSDRTVEEGMTTAAGDYCNNCSTENNLSGSPDANETDFPLVHDDTVEISNSKSDSTIPSTNLCDFVIADMKTSSPLIYGHDKSSMKTGDYNPIEEDTIESISRTPDQSGYFSENPASISEPEMKKRTGGKWALRKTAKQSHRKADSQGNGCHSSDGLINGFFKDCTASGGVKLDCCSDAVTDVDHRVAAVMAGLKSRATTPIEKILFKDVFRRKGGLQEYLEIRNRILGLWGKDISRALLPTDYGLADIYSENDPSRFSLFRDIYRFLDQRGYINIGVATNKNDTAPLATIMNNYGSSRTDIMSRTGTDLACQNPEFLYPEKKREKKIIVVGAGPAGLTAAQHLQRQGFSVTVLEGRNRIGGRVFTDRTSLSVPVDLGASIITGVEADTVTERRPDPSSLICRQLGIELTVLDSDCPLYDTVSGQKVPSCLDEELEAEFNSLLDDTVLLVAHEGEHASKMSLEDGLEFVLRRRRRSPEFIGRRLLEPEGNILSPLERRVMDWHFAHLEYGCAALLGNVSLPCWNQDDAYGGFGGAHCMVRGGYSSVVESVGKGLDLRLGHTVTGVHHTDEEIRVLTSDGVDFSGDAVLLTVPLGCLKAETISFYPPLPEWKTAAIHRLGFGILNKVALEFTEMFWDESVDYFGATSVGTAERGLCFMFWNVEKTVGAPVLISLVVGKAAVEGEMGMDGPDYVSHAVGVLRKIFGDVSVPDPVGSVVTDWGRDPFSHGAYSYVALGATGEDYDLLARPVGNRVFFAGEGTCKEHPDTVGGAMLSGIREAVRIADVLVTGKDHMAEVEAMEAAHKLLENRRSELGDIIKRLDSVELSTVDGSGVVTREALLEDMFYNAKTTSGRLHLAKELLGLPPESLKQFAGNKKGLAILNMWILDSMGKDGTQLLRHCVRILVLVSTNLVAVRLSGIGKTVKEKVCVHSSRDIRAVASQLVAMWVEVFRKEKTALKSLRCQASAKDSSRCKPVKDPHVECNTNTTKIEASLELKSGIDSPPAQGGDFSTYDTISEEEKALVAVEESARAAAVAAAQAYASSEAKYGGSLHQLPKIPSFHKYARREQYAQMEETEAWRRGSGIVSARQDCMSEIDSRNCRVKNWSVDFSAACVNPDEGYNPTRVRATVDHQWNDYTWQSVNRKEYSSESNAVESSMFTRAWVDTEGSVKDYHSIERWRSQAAPPDEDDSTTGSERRFPPAVKWDHAANESTVSHITTDRNAAGRQFKGSDHMKQAVVDYVASLLMPLYKARKVDKDGYKSIMKKAATKVIEQATDAEKSMPIYNFLDSKRKNKIRDFVDKLLERHLQQHPTAMDHNTINT